MSQTLNLLLPALAYLASTAGAGIAASQLFDWLRAKFSGAQPPRVDWLLSSRIGARLTVMVLACLISVAAALLIALITGQDIGPALDQALAAIVASQLYHLKDMRGEIAAEVAGFVFTPDAPRKDAQR